MMRILKIKACSVAIVAVLATSPCAAQEVQLDSDTYAIPAPAPQRQFCEIGCTAETGVGQVGLRQTRDNPALNIEPSRRIENRIRSRVESRLKTRIDRGFSGPANATVEIERASNRVTSANPDLSRK